MAKESKNHKATKSNKGHMEHKGPSTMVTKDHRPGQEGRLANETGKPQKGRDIRLADAQNSQGVSLNEGQDSQGLDLPEVTTTKSGCLPKLLMILLPFIAVGTYLLSRS
jgi:hypothetical protein